MPCDCAAIADCFSNLGNDARVPCPCPLSDSSGSAIWTISIWESSQFSARFPNTLCQAVQVSKNEFRKTLAFNCYVIGGNSSFYAVLQNSVARNSCGWRHGNSSKLPLKPPLTPFAEKKKKSNSNKCDVRGKMYGEEVLGRSAVVRGTRGRCTVPRVVTAVTKTARRRRSSVAASTQATSICFPRWTWTQQRLWSRWTLCAFLSVLPCNENVFHTSWFLLTQSISGVPEYWKEGNIFFSLSHGGHRWGSHDNGTPVFVCLRLVPSRRFLLVLNVCQCCWYFPLQ